MDLIDSTMFDNISGFIYTLGPVIGTFFLLSYTTPLFIVPGIAIVIVFICLQVNVFLFSSFIGTKTHRKQDRGYLSIAIHSKLVCFISQFIFLVGYMRKPSMLSIKVAPYVCKDKDSIYMKNELLFVFFNLSALFPISFSMSTSDMFVR